MMNNVICNIKSGCPYRKEPFCSLPYPVINAAGACSVWYSNLGERYQQPRVVGEYMHQPATEEKSQVLEEEVKASENAEKPIKTEIQAESEDKINE